MSTSIFHGTTRARPAARVSLRPPVAPPILDAPLASHETAHDGFRREERDEAGRITAVGTLPVAHENTTTDEPVQMDRTAVSVMSRLLSRPLQASGAKGAKTDDSTGSRP
jgi:hypothetical protein